MDTKATFAIAEIKAAQSENPNGEFEIIMSTDSVDRDGEIIVKGAFDPLPESIPVHAFHDFSDPIGRATPSYNENGQLVGRGFFASTSRAQELRQLVSDGVIGHTSVGFMGTERAMKDGVPHITAAELLEVSFVSVPSNRDAAVLMAKEFDAKAGARNSSKDSDRLQAAHDLLVANGAKCAEADADGEKSPTPEDIPAVEVEEKSTDEVDTDTTGAAETDDGDDLALRARALSLAAYLP